MSPATGPATGSPSPAPGSALCRCRPTAGKGAVELRPEAKGHALRWEEAWRGRGGGPALGFTGGGQGVTPRGLSPACTLGCGDPRPHTEPGLGTVRGRWGPPTLTLLKSSCVCSVYICSMRSIRWAPSLHCFTSYRARTREQVLRARPHARPVQPSPAPRGSGPHGCPGPCPAPGSATV